MIHDEADLARLDAAAAAAARDLFGFGAHARAERVAVSENATYRLSAPDGAPPAAALRFYRPGARTDAAIASELAWISALRADGAVHTPAVVPDADGRTVRLLAARPAAAFAWDAGEPLDDPPAARPRRFASLGALAARLHDHAARWTPPPGFTRPRWDWNGTLGADRPWGDYGRAPGLDDAGRALLDRTAARLDAVLSTYGTAPDRFGLIHGDLRAANLLARGDALAVIDFDDCGFGWHGYDFAASASFHEHEPGLETLAAAWCDGYRTVRPLAAGDEAMLPAFVTLRRLMLTAWVGSHPNADPVRALDGTFTAGTCAVAAWFLAGG